MLERGPRSSSRWRMTFSGAAVAATLLLWNPHASAFEASAPRAPVVPARLLESPGVPQIDDGQQKFLVQGPKFKMVLHIRDFVVGGTGDGGAFDSYFNTEPMATAFGNLSTTNPVQATVYAAAVKAMLHGLQQSSNTEPPWHFKSKPPGREFVGGAMQTGKVWTDFVASKQYRGFISMDRFTLLCDGNNRLINRQPVPTGAITDYTEAKLQMSHGYTSEPQAFVAGEPMTVPIASPVNSAGIDRTNAADECIVWKAQMYGRIGNPARAAAHAVLGFDAPFVFIKAKYKLCCSGAYSIERAASHFPTTSTYLNDVFQVENVQSNLGRFIASGGVVLNAAGTGNLADEVLLATLTGNTPGRWPQNLVAQDDERLLTPPPPQVSALIPTRCQPLQCGIGYPAYDCEGAAPATGLDPDPVVSNSPSTTVACAGTIIDFNNATPTNANHPTFETCSGPQSNGFCCEGSTTPNHCPGSCPLTSPPFCPSNLSSLDCSGGIDPGPKAAVNCRPEGASCTSDNECCFQGCNGGVCDATHCIFAAHRRQPVVVAPGKAGGDAPPVFLPSFTLAHPSDAVEVRWTVRQQESRGEFIVRASRGEQRWDVPVDAPRDLEFVAYDRSPQAAAGGEMVYRLFYKSPGEPWRKWAEQAITVGTSPNSAWSCSVRPNPARERVVIAMSNARGGHARLTVHDVAGREVARVFEGPLRPGSGQWNWSGRDSRGVKLASGIYLVRLVTEQGTETHKLVLMD